MTDDDGEKTTKPSADASKRSVRMVIRFSSEEDTRFREVADSCGLKPATFIRMAARLAANGRLSIQKKPIGHDRPISVASQFSEEEISKVRKAAANCEVKKSVYVYQAVLAFMNLLDTWTANL